MKGTTATGRLERLNPFVGSWHTEGEMLTGAHAKFEASDEYEWLPGGHFLLHRFDAQMPEGRVQGIEIIGGGVEDDVYPMHSFDSQGHEGFLLARVDGGTWTFSGDTMRFAGRFVDEGRTFTGLWQLRSDDGSWQPWMSVRLRRRD